jgi:hypothetical protein
MAIFRLAADEIHERFGAVPFSWLGKSAFNNHFPHSRGSSNLFRIIRKERAVREQAGLQLFCAACKKIRV